MWWQESTGAFARNLKRGRKVTLALQTLNSHTPQAQSGDQCRLSQPRVPRQPDSPHTAIHKTTAPPAGREPYACADLHVAKREEGGPAHNHRVRQECIKSFASRRENRRDDSFFCVCAAETRRAEAAEGTKYRANILQQDALDKVTLTLVAERSGPNVA